MLSEPRRRPARRGGRGRRRMYGVRSRDDLRKPIVEPRPDEAKDPRNDDEHDEGAEKAAVGEPLRQERGDVGTEELRVEQEPESVAPDDRQDVEGEIENAGEYGQRSCERDLVQHDVSPS